MKIGIIGAGMIGATAARLFIKAGHQVALCNSRGPDSLKELIDELGPNAKALDKDKAAKYGEVVLLAVPWRKPEALPSPGTVKNKVVIDAMNPYGPDGNMMDLGEDTSSEATARRLPAARIVKAFNTIWFKHLAENGDTRKPASERHAILFAGDDEAAKQVVYGLIMGIGFAPIDSGSLHEGGLRQQPNAPLYGKAITGKEAAEALAQFGKSL